MFQPQDQPYLAIETYTDEHGTWVLLRGQADLSNQAYLQATLTAIELDGSRSVHLQVGHLDFCDIGAMRQLLLFARRWRQAGRDVITDGARPTFRKVARLLDVDRELGLAGSRASSRKGASKSPRSTTPLPAQRPPTGR